MILVEASVAIAGFSGVVVAVGRRATGEWSPLERSRLLNLLSTSFAVLFYSLGALVLLHAGTAETILWRIGSMGWALGATGAIVIVARRLAQIPRGDAERPSTASRVFWLGGTGVFVALSLLNAFTLGDFWPFLASQVWLFGLACMSFSRLLLVLGRGEQAE